MNVSALNKPLQKLQLSLQAGQAYEGQQMIKTVYHRFRSRKKLVESYQVLEGAATQQLAAGQVTCGVELGFLLLEAFASDKVVANDAALRQILHVLQSFPGPTADGSADQDDAPRLCCKLAVEAIRWARNHPMGDLALQQDTAGSPEQQIHNHLARYIWEFYGVPGLGWASLHFAHGSEPFRFAAAIATAAEQAPRAELDLFLTRAALQILCTNSRQGLQLCKEFLQASEGICSQTELDIPNTPLYSFVHLLLEAIAVGSLELVNLLRQEYVPALEADSTFEALLEQVVSRHFNVAPAGGTPSFISTMLDMLNSDEG